MAIQLAQDCAVLQHQDDLLALPNVLQVVEAVRLDNCLKLLGKRSVNSSCLASLSHWELL